MNPFLYSFDTDSTFLRRLTVTGFICSGCITITRPNVSFLCLGTGGVSGHFFQSCEELAGNLCKLLEYVQCPTVIMSPDIPANLLKQTPLQITPLLTLIFKASVE